MGQNWMPHSETFISVNLSCVQSVWKLQQHIYNEAGSKIITRILRAPNYKPHPRIFKMLPFDHASVQNPLYRLYADLTMSCSSSHKDFSPLVFQASHWTRSTTLQPVAAKIKN